VASDTLLPSTTHGSRPALNGRPGADVRDSRPDLPKARPRPERLGEYRRELADGLWLVVELEVTAHDCYVHDWRLTDDPDDPDRYVSCDLWLELVIAAALDRRLYRDVDGRGDEPQLGPGLIGYAERRVELIKAARQRRRLP
jgi:hypothetical protein